MLRRAAITPALLFVLSHTACAAPAPPGAAAARRASEESPAQASTAQPRIRNAQITARAAGQGLDHEFRALVAEQQQSAWIGYAVPLVNEHTVCCGGWREGYSTGCCRMEEDDGMNMRSPGEGQERELAVVALDPALFVFYRAADRKVTNIRIFSADCGLDAGGRPVNWLTGVRPDESIALLQSFVRGATDWSEHDDRSLAKRAVAAIALHAGTAADRALEGLAAPSQPQAVRKHVTFWLGEARGQRGYQVLLRMTREDPSDEVRNGVVFGLYVSKQPQAVDAMIAVARDDPSTQVRGQALFWLAQKAGHQAAAAITQAIENDPETDVKKKAVFALSQLPKDEGVPLLIQVARTNRNPAVRKQAMFWLGQSGDPRALAFFEEVLKR